MTDNEIIRALMYCLDYKGNCENCPYRVNEKGVYCIRYFPQASLDLINRKQAEIEELKSKPLVCQFTDEELAKTLMSQKVLYVPDDVESKQAEIDHLEIELQAMRGAANSYKMQNERLLGMARAMHTWIFLHTGDEEKAYEECGLTNEDNALLGYCGKLEFFTGGKQDG